MRTVQAENACTVLLLVRLRPAKGDDTCDGIASLQIAFAIPPTKTSDFSHICALLDVQSSVFVGSP